MSTYNLVTRAQWGARLPQRTVPLDWSIVDKFIVHYSGAVRTQTPRSIQNYCMDSKGHSDIDYNDLVRGKDRFVGRGSNVGSHTLGLNSSSYGVCVIGNDGDATDDDFRVVREIYDELTGSLGRQLRKLGHRTAMPPGYTTCPGDEIQAWIDRGMPYPEDNMLDPLEGAQVNNSEHYLQSIIGMTLEAKGISNVSNPNLTVPNQLAATLLEIKERLDTGVVTGITEAKLREIIREEIAKTKLS
jgi:hypothetical protein